jgi:decaprenylphospho-beta-D-ribofuranose 2-oxidase
MFTKISGWGNSLHSLSFIKALSQENSGLNEANSRGAIPRGLGRSYGDSANNSGGTVLYAEGFSHKYIDPQSGIAVVGAGVTLHSLESDALKLGFFPFVVPGTAEVTIGGAIASDIHGKSHHRVGSFSNHLIEMKLLTGEGSLRVLRPNGENSRLFWATVGGMGLTGVIIEATIQLLKVETAFVTVTEKRVLSLEELLKVLLEFNSKHTYTVAWVDLSGSFKGKGIVSAADHAKMEHISTKNHTKILKPINLKSFRIPFTLKNGLINRFSIRVFNLFWFYKPLGKKIQHIQKYMHPLDGIANWNVLYGSKGFTQYQFVVPLNRIEVLRTIIERFKNEKCGSFLTVLKSFGDCPTGLIGFPMSGWTLAIDLPNNARNLSQILRDVDRLVINAGGRIYLTKDSRLNHEHLISMYPDLNEWKGIKREIDPRNYWQSDQGRRLKLC